MLRCGLIGYGAWGSHHARVIAASAHACLVAIAARSEATCARARQDHPGCHVVTDPRELLAREDLDAVAVVLPSHLHFEAARAVLVVAHPVTPNETITSGTDDARARFLRDRLTDAIETLAPLLEYNCTRKQALHGARAASQSLSNRLDVRALSPNQLRHQRR